jgi:hypothetical protein
MARWKAQAGDLAGGIDHFLKVTRSYWSGLFRCYDIKGLPRTNNDLEQVFGSGDTINVVVQNAKLPLQLL